jgi:adenylate kinase
MNPIVFVGGIHGVGKSTLCRHLAERLAASYVTAGGLIRENAAADHVVTVGIGDKAVPNVDANQAALLRGLDLYRQRVGPGRIVLDGHFSLLDATGAIVDVPTAVYEAIAPVAVALVEAANAVVHARRVERDGAAPSEAIIGLHAARERTRAADVAATLGIPLWSVSGETDAMSAAVETVQRLTSLFGNVA